ncbi:MAG: hypothetical protein NVSMB38_43190 [Ktedonobacteraceae bacterium]
MGCRLSSLTERKVQGRNDKPTGGEDPDTRDCQEQDNGSFPLPLDPLCFRDLTPHFFLGWPFWLLLDELKQLLVQLDDVLVELVDELNKPIANGKNHFRRNRKGMELIVDLCAPFQQ